MALARRPDVRVVVVIVVVAVADAVAVVFVVVEKVIDQTLPAGRMWASNLFLRPLDIFEIYRNIA